MKTHLNLSLTTFLAAVLLSAGTLTARADGFTQAEQQQISIPTPGLFDKSDAFTVDFAALRLSEFCFPLPVGKAQVVDNDRIEITSSKGDAVMAMFAGQVRLSRKTASHGNVIVIRHDNGLETVYAHNAQNLVKVGQTVKAGQTIAIIGGKDGKTLCEVAIMINGGRINPSTLLDVPHHRLYRQTIMCRKRSNHVDVSVVGEAKKKSSETKSDTPVRPFENSNQYRLDLSAMQSCEWSYPLPGCKVISPYGGKRRHAGVDLKTKPKDNILAAFDGVVTRSGPHYGYGNCISIRHYNGLETLYSHQSKNLVKVGDKVKAGQVIGLTGRTGRATTEHLHFEVSFQGRRINPNIIFDHAAHSLQPGSVTFHKNGKVVPTRR